jgi:hypothetical protein
MNVFWWEMRFAARALVKRPGFSAAAILTLALALGSTTVIFGFVDGVLLRPLPYADPDRLVAVWEVDESPERITAGLVTDGFFEVLGRAPNPTRPP